MCGTIRLRRGLGLLVSRKTGQPWAGAGQWRRHFPACRTVQSSSAAPGLLGGLGPEWRRQARPHLRRARLAGHYRAAQAGAAGHALALGTYREASVGKPMMLTIVVQDAWNNTATGYTGTVRLVCDDSRASSATKANPRGLLRPLPFCRGQPWRRSFAITFMTPGKHTITISDTIDSALTASVTVTVTSPDYILCARRPGSSFRSLAPPMT